jgi:hypothetical protein
METILGPGRTSMTTMKRSLLKRDNIADGFYEEEDRLLHLLHFELLASQSCGFTPFQCNDEAVALMTAVRADCAYCIVALNCVVTVPLVRLKKRKSGVADYIHEICSSCTLPLWLYIT